MVTSKWLTKTKPSREQYLSFSQEMSARSMHYLQLFFLPARQCTVCVLTVYIYICTIAPLGTLYRLQPTKKQTVLPLSLRYVLYPLYRAGCNLR